MITSRSSLSRPSQWLVRLRNSLMEIVVMAAKVSLVSLAVNRQHRRVAMAWSVCPGFSWLQRKRSGFEDDPLALGIAV